MSKRHILGCHILICLTVLLWMKVPRLLTWTLTETCLGAETGSAPTAQRGIVLRFSTWFLYASLGLGPSHPQIPALIFLLPALQQSRCGYSERSLGGAALWGPSEASAPGLSSPISKVLLGSCATQVFTPHSQCSHRFLSVKLLILSLGG